MNQNISIIPLLLQYQKRAITIKTWKLNGQSQQEKDRGHYLRLGQLSLEMTSMKWTGYPYIVHGINNKLRKKYRHKCPSMEEAARTKKSREFNYYGTAFMITIDTYMVSNTCIHTYIVST